MYLTPYPNAFSYGLSTPIKVPKVNATPLSDTVRAYKPSSGVSLITQAFYAGVFVTRYGDLFWTVPWSSWWNFVLKIFYITSSFYIILIMMKVYARTREREKAWKLGAYCLGGSLVLAPVFAAIAVRKDITFFQVTWTFSIILESVCIIPQLLLLRQTTVPTVIDSGYILTLGSYRALYILNWILRFAHKTERNPDWRAVMFGVIQTAFYVDFAWVYWTRQRVKLRNGGVVDSDDLSRGFLVSKLLGRGESGTDEETGPLEGTTNDGGAQNAKAGGRWGRRGISVSADENVILPGNQQKASTNANARDDDLGDFMDDDDDESENGRVQHGQH